jgi:ribonuclease HI
MLVTIITDASHCPDTHGAGYGFWIASGRGKVGGGGTMKSQVENANVAEMHAVCNALHHALKVGLVVKMDSVLIQTDCLGAIHAFDGTRKPRLESELKAKEVLDRFRDKFALTIGFRHVKGHTSRPEARYVTNRLCDSRAKEGMRKARKQLRLNKEAA